MSEGGLLVLHSEQLEIGQNLRLNLFVDAGPDLISIEAIVEVVWKDIHVGADGESNRGEIPGYLGGEYGPIEKLLRFPGEFRILLRDKNPIKIGLNPDQFFPPEPLQAKIDQLEQCALSGREPSFYLAFCGLAEKSKLLNNRKGRKKNKGILRPVLPP